MDIRAGSFLDAHAGEEGAAGAGMIAGAVGAGGGVYLIEAGVHLHLLAQLGQRLHRLVEDVILAFAGGPEVGGNSAVGEVNKRSAERRAGGGDRNLPSSLRRRGTRAATKQRLKRRQRDA